MSHSGAKESAGAALMKDRALAAMAVCAIVWVAARACVQSITIDEADTYLGYVAGAEPRYWIGAANNHLLNSMLMRLSISLFGLHPLSARAPAMLGAAAYTCACCRLAARSVRQTSLRLAVLAALLFNPFVMDYLVAARGYSLALGLLMAALALGLDATQPGLGAVRVTRLALWSSVCAGLSVCANFSFAPVNVCLLVLVFVWLLRQLSALRAFSMCALPALAIVAVLAGPVLVHWGAGQFVFGTRSLAQMLRSVVVDSLYRPNPFLVAPRLCRAIGAAGVYVVVLLLAACCVRAIAFFASRKPSGWRSEECRRAGFALLLTLATAGVHRLLYRLIHLLMPLDRTAVYLAPLAVLALAGAAALPLAGAAPRVLHGITLAAFWALACYFVLCLRLDYFQEWKFDEHVDRAYDVLSYLDHDCGLTRVAANWRYVATLNFYRAMSGRESIRKVEPGPPPQASYPAGEDVYVLYLPDDRPFAEREHLRILHEDDDGLGVAVRGVCAEDWHSGA